MLDKTNPCFRDLLKTLDSVSSDLHRQGVGATKHSAPIISQEHEELFWKKGLLGLSSPKVLQRTVFYYVGLNFVLRRVQEQHDLVPAQFVRVPSDFAVYDSSVYYEYTEFISKNNQHRFKDVIYDHNLNSGNHALSSSLCLAWERGKHTDCCENVLQQWHTVSGNIFRSKSLPSPNTYTAPMTTPFVCPRLTLLWPHPSGCEELHVLPKYRCRRYYNWLSKQLDVEMCVMWHTWKPWKLDMLW